MSNNRDYSSIFDEQLYGPPKLSAKSSQHPSKSNATKRPASSTDRREPARSAPISKKRPRTPEYSDDDDDGPRSYNIMPARLNPRLFDTDIRGFHPDQLFRRPRYYERDENAPESGSDSDDMEDLPMTIEEEEERAERIARMEDRREKRNEEERRRKRKERKLAEEKRR